MEIKDSTTDVVKPSKRNKKGIFTINRDTLPYKMHYFLFLGAMSCVLPYKVVFSKSRLNMTGTEIASMYTTLQFLVILTKPGIGAIVDYFNKLKLVIVVLTLTQAICFLLLLAIPPIEAETPAFSGFTNGKIFMKRSHIDKAFSTKIQDIYICLRNGNWTECFQHDSSVVYSIDDDTTYISTLEEKGKCELMYNSSTEATLDLLEICGFQGNWPTEFVHLNQYNQSTTIINCSVFTIESGELDMWNTSLQNSPCLNGHKNFLLYTIDLKNGSMVTNESPRSVYSTYQYWTYFLLTLVASIGTNGLFTLSDTACYECLAKTGADYGKQRLWGALSWGILAPFAGFLNDLASASSNQTDYSPGFYFMTVLAIAEIINIWRLDLVKPNASRSILKDLGTVFASVEFIVFELGVFFIGIFTGFIWFYLMVYIEGLGGNRLVMGLVQTSQCFLGELPFMFFSGWIVKKIGHINILVLSFLFFAIRFGCYSVITNPWFVLPVEISHGLTYGVFYTAMTAYGKLSARPGTEATTQAVLCCTYEGLGAGVGCVLAGVGFDKIGSQATFRVASIASFCVALIYASSIWVLKLGKRKIPKI